MKQSNRDGEYNIYVILFFDYNDMMFLEIVKFYSSQFVISNLSILNGRRKT